MTVKEFNALRAKVYQEAIEMLPEAAELIRTEGVAYIYEIEDRKGQHGYAVVSRSSQVNSNTLRALGYDPDEPRIRLQLTLNRATKCAVF